MAWTPAGSPNHPFAYDGNGNMTSGTIAGIPWTFGYDPKNRLLTAGGGSVSATYAYDPLGRRTHKSGSGVTGTYYLNSGTDQIAEYDSSGALTRRFVPGPAVDEYLATLDAAGNRTYYHTDAHGSVIAVTTANAALRCRQVLRYCEPVGQSGTTIATWKMRTTARRRTITTTRTVLLRSPT